MILEILDLRFSVESLIIDDIASLFMSRELIFW